MAVPCKSGQFLTMKQAISLLAQAGFPAHDIPIMGATGKGESLLCPLAYNKNGEYSIGWLQINMQAHGTRFGTEQQLYDPLINAKGAKIIYDMQGKRAWGAYSNGRYKEFLPEAEKAFAELNGNYIISSIPSNLISGAGMPINANKFLVYAAVAIVGLSLIKQ